MGQLFKIFLRAVVVLLTALNSVAYAQDWSQILKAVASDRGSADYFGWSVALSGDYAIIGAPFQDSGDNQNAGTAYIFRNFNGQWKEVKNLAPPVRQANDNFGWSVDISGDFAIVGAAGEQGASGAVYIFEKNKGGEDNWGEAKKVRASTPAFGDMFGYSVSISGEYAIIGAHLESEDPFETNTATASGSAYIFFRGFGGPDNWGQAKKLTAPVRAEGDNFGISVAISGNHAIVGAHSEDQDASEANTLENSGSAYIFVKGEGGPDNWSLVKKLTATARSANDYFGRSVSISGNYAAVGAYWEDDDATEATPLGEAGSAYIFGKDQGSAGNWGVVKKVTASARNAGDNFGVSVCISGDFLIVGSNFADDSAGSNMLSASGAAYIFSKNQGGAGTWGFVKKITPSAMENNDHFGYSVAITNAYVFVGSIYEDQDSFETTALTDAGSVYIFANPLGSLPVTLASFEAEKVENAALLRWTTSSETNTANFEIERSADAKIWQTIGNVKAAKESSQLRSYSYTDLTPLSGQNLYRLKMIDLDQTFAYSRIRNLYFESNGDFTIYPNPVSDKLLFKSSIVASIESVRMINMLGQNVWDTSKITEDGVSISHLTPGIYTVQLAKKDKTTQSVKIVVAR